jgi:hypothetical protein
MRTFLSLFMLIAQLAYGATPTSSVCRESCAAGDARCVVLGRLYLGYVMHKGEKYKFGSSRNLGEKNTHFLP